MDYSRLNVRLPPDLYSKAETNVIYGLSTARPTLSGQTLL